MEGKPDQVSAMRELTQAVDNQNAALEGVSAQIKYLKSSEARSRNFLRLVTITLLFDICLSVVLGLVAVRSNDAADKARNATVVACRSSNEVRANEVQLWNYLLEVSAAQQAQQPNPNLTEAQRASQQQLLVQFRAKVALTFQPRDCSKL